MSFDKMGTLLGIFLPATLVGCQGQKAQTTLPQPAPQLGRAIEISEAELEDRVRGGMRGQIIGNMNGLPHEFKYEDEPGNVTEYTPALPKGAFTDDDTDIEWVYAAAMQEQQKLFLDDETMRQLWQRHINDGIWCANKFARVLMDMQFSMDRVGTTPFNPWSDFNIAGQFITESFGLMAPGMPQLGSRLGLQYAGLTVDGEPEQATQLFSSMIAAAYVESDVQTLLATGLKAVDPASAITAVVEDVWRSYRNNGDDWRKTRWEIKRRYQRVEGETRDKNGYELNTAASVAALLHGEGDFTKTLRLAFNMGWDADNNAATAAAVLGAIKGRAWMDQQGWEINDVYKNERRDGMPKDETISGFENRIVEIAKLAIVENGGERFERDGKAYFRINTQAPANVQSLAQSRAQREKLKKESLAQVPELLAGDALEKARGAYLAIVLKDYKAQIKRDPAAWQAAITELAKQPDLLNVLFGTPRSSWHGSVLREAAREAGLSPKGVAPDAFMATNP